MRYQALGCILFACVSFVCAPGSSASTNIEIVDCWFREDRVFPEFTELWSNVAAKEAAELGPHSGPQQPAGSVHLYVRNGGASACGVEDIVVNGVSLKRAIAPRKGEDGDASGAAGVHFSDLSDEERAAFRSAGAPIWWKADPETVPPGGFAEITIRLRVLPQAGRIKLGVRFSGGSFVERLVQAKDGRPRIEDICFSRKLDRVYVFVRRPSGGSDAPVQVLMDGRDLTQKSRVSHDPNLSVNVLVLTLPSPLMRDSLHLFQVVYPKSGSAVAAARAWEDEPAYGIWGARPARADELGLAENYLRDIAAHNINVQMEMIGSEGVADLLKSDEGQGLMASLGIRRMVSEPGKGRTRNPYAYFLQDEPDAKDFYVKEVPANERLGSAIPSLVAEINDYRRTDPLTPNLVNVDMTFKPDNYRVYGQLTDIFCTDPYYQPRIFQSFTECPSRVSLYTKATFVLASAIEAKSACAPKPLHVILFSTRGGRVRRFPAPQEKRIELYYALGAGAKGISYWWYTPGEKAEGCGSDDPEAKALWKEIGLLGAEFGVLSSLVARSAPIELSMKLPERVWGRGLLAGDDSLVLLLVNDDYACDRLGISVKPVSGAFAQASLPQWLVPRDVFEIDASGIRGVTWSRVPGGVKAELGTLQVSRAVVITSDPGLRSELQQLYESRYAPKVKSLLEEE